VKYINYSALALSLMVSLTACGGGGGGDTTQPPSSPETKNITMSGQAIDGYISGATACLDLNINAQCDTNEPTTTTATDGTFRFSNVEVEKGKLFPVIVSGGIDTATNKSFTGELKNIIDSETITSSQKINVTPLTDLVAISYINAANKSSTTLQESKSVVASSLGLTKEKVDADPMKDKEVFAKAQLVEQTKTLLLASAAKAKNISIGSSDAKVLAKEIETVVVESLQSTTTKTLDTDIIIQQLQKKEINIPENEKTFLTSQILNMKSALDESVGDAGIQVADLVETQQTLETQVATATKNIQDASEGTAIAVVEIKLGDGGIAVTLPTPPSVPTL
jgi:hypothetical protein